MFNHGNGFLTCKLGALLRGRLLLFQRIRADNLLLIRMFFTETSEPDPSSAWAVCLELQRPRRASVFETAPQTRRRLVVNPWP